MQGQKDQCLTELRKLQEEIKRYKNADKEYRDSLITVGMPLRPFHRQRPEMR